MKSGLKEQKPKRKLKQKPLSYFSLLICARLRANPFPDPAGMIAIGIFIEQKGSSR